jgi:hypothetical protein
MAAERIGNIARMILCNVICVDKDQRRRSQARCVQFLPVTLHFSTGTDLTAHGSPSMG